MNAASHHTKTTVYLDRAAYQQLQRLARARGQTAAALVREAVAEYARRHARGGLPRSLAAGRSGRKDLGAKAEQLLKGMGRER